MKCECGNEHCSIRLYRDMFIKPDLSKLKKSHHFKIIQKFYSNLETDFNALYSEHIKKAKARGNRTFASKIFQKNLKAAVEAMGKTVEQEKDILSKSYTDFLKTKRIDLFVNRKMAVEIKTWIEFNHLGAAYLEAMVCSFEKFFIAGLSTIPKNYLKLRELVKKTGMISDVVVFNPKIEGFEEGVLGFFDAIARA